jgi:hypothetical protein
MPRWKMSMFRLGEIHRSVKNQNGHCLWYGIAVIHRIDNFYCKRRKGTVRLQRLCCIADKT